jgi:hypothetical protein
MSLRPTVKSPVLAGAGAAQRSQDHVTAIQMVNWGTTPMAVEATDYR